MIFGWLRDFGSMLNVNVCSYSYTGYARSEGEPSEEHVYADIEAAWDMLVTERRIPPNHIVMRRSESYTTLDLSAGTREASGPARPYTWRGN